MSSELDAVIVGGGLAGLTCAKLLCAEGLQCRILEASDAVGGRIRTDNFGGFLLDRGFQVFLTAYPEAHDILNYDDLELCPFEPGALVRYNEGLHRFADPWRRPRHLLATAVSPVASLLDKLRVANFRVHVNRGDINDLFQRPEQSTIDLLRERRFSNKIIERFFQPFLGGVFLDHDLNTSSRMCEFVFRMFSRGDAALPAKGMGQIPQQVAAQLPDDVVQLNSPVDSLDGSEVLLTSGDRLAARHLIIATEAPAAAKLLKSPIETTGKSVACIYYAADKPPLEEPILVLNGDGKGPINNLCVPSQVSPHYAPSGQSLVSVTVLGRHDDSSELHGQVTSQLKSWFGDVVGRWRHLRTYQIDYALPNQSTLSLNQGVQPAVAGDRILVCGDHQDTASINGAIASGRRAAEAILSSHAENFVR